MRDPPFIPRVAGIIIRSVAAITRPTRRRGRDDVAVGHDPSLRRTRLHAQCAAPAGAPRLARAVRALTQERSGPNDVLGPDEADVPGATPTASTWRRSAKPAGRTCSIAAARPDSSRSSRRRPIGFADFRGNLQHVSTGNALGNDRASIIVDGLRASPPAEAPRPSAVRRRWRTPIRSSSAAWSCPAIAPASSASRSSTWPPSTGTARSTSRRASRKAQIDAATQPLRDRIAELEARLAAATVAGLIAALRRMTAPAAPPRRRRRRFAARFAQFVAARVEGATAGCLGCSHGCERCRPRTRLNPSLQGELNPIAAAASNGGQHQPATGERR